MIETGDFRSRKQTTGRLLFKRNGEFTYIDFGNVRMHKHEANIKRTQTATARKGYVEITHEQPNEIENRWTVGLDEELPALTRLDLLAGVHTDVSQDTGAAVTASFTVKKGQVLDLGKRDVTITSVKVSTTAKVEGTDYTVDAKAGLITILRNGSIADAATVDVVFDCAAVPLYQHVSGKELTVTGTVRFDEYDQNSDIPRATYTFTAQIIMSNRGDNDGKKNSEFEVQLLATGAMTRIGRNDT